MKKSKPVKKKKRISLGNIVCLAKDLPMRTSGVFVLHDPAANGGDDTYYSAKHPDLWTKNPDEASCMTADVLLNVLEECDNAELFRERFVARRVRVHDFPLRWVDASIRPRHLLVRKYTGRGTSTVSNATMDDVVDALDSFALVVEDRLQQHVLDEELSVALWRAERAERVAKENEEIANEALRAGLLMARNARVSTFEERTGRAFVRFRSLQEAGGQDLSELEAFKQVIAEFLRG